MSRPEEIPDPAPEIEPLEPEFELEIGLCGPEHRAEQARLFNACFRKTVDGEDLSWRYDQNPHGRSVSLLCRPPGGDGVSGYACSPRRAVPGGQEASAAPVGQTGDVMTHPDWRKRGLFSGLDRRAMEEIDRLGWPIVFGLPNRRSAHIFLKLGWRAVGKIRPWSFVLQPGADARRARRPDGRLRSWMVPLAASWGRAARKRLRQRAGGVLGVRTIESFPAEVEELSRLVEPGFALMVRRDADYLNWRFCRNPSRLHRVLGVYDGQGALAGYVVVQPPRDDSVVGYLVDLLARDEVAFAAALEAGLAHLDVAGASLVQATAVDGSWWGERLAASGFQPPRRENHLIVILYTHRADHPLARAGLDASRWYLTDGDRDDETMG